MNTYIPKISIITVCYNEYNCIRETLESVIYQTYKNKEFIVVDGGSTDGTKNIIQEYTDFIDIFISEKDNGIYDAMNKGVVRACGEWIIFINGGDKFYSKDVIENVFKNKINSYSSVLYGHIVLKLENGTNTIINKEDYSLYRLPFMPSGHECCFVKTKYLKTLFFNTRFKISADIDFFKRLYSINNNYQFVDNPICIFKSYGGVSTTYSYKYFKEYYFAITSLKYIPIIKLKAIVHYILLRVKKALSLK